MPSCTMAFCGAGAPLPSAWGAESPLKVRSSAWAGASVIQQPVSSQKYCCATQHPWSLQ